MPGVIKTLQCDNGWVIAAGTTGGLVATADVSNDAITFAKLQNLTASKILGRGSAGGTGDAEELTIGSNLSLVGTTLSATSSGGTVTSVQVSGGTTGLTFTGGPVTTTGTMTAGGTLGVANGGSGKTSVGVNQLLAGGAMTGTDPFVSISSGTAGQVLTSNGSSLPSFQTFTPTIANDSITFAKIQNITASRLLGRGSMMGSGDTEEITISTGLSLTGTTLTATGSGGTVTSVGLSGGTTGLTVTNSPVTTTGTMTLGGTLSSSNGGTGTGTLTAYAVVCGPGTAGMPLQSVSGVGTSGQVLTSNGITTLPTWQSPAGLSIGGTVGSGTTGSVLFVGAGGMLQQDNSNLFYDDMNDRLGIGINSPVAKLHVRGTDATNGQIRIDSTNASANLTLGFYQNGSQVGTIGFKDGGASPDKIGYSVSTANATHEFEQTVVISNATPTLHLTDTTLSAKSLTMICDSNIAQLRESAGASGSLLALDLANNRLGVGTASPAVSLDCRGGIDSLYTSGFRLMNSGSMLGQMYYSGGVNLDRATATKFQLQEAGSNQLVVLTGGNVGIGTSTPGEKLDLVGNMQFSGSTNRRIMFSPGSNAASSLDMDWHSEVTTAVAAFRLFRSTNTTGQVYFDILKGDNSGTVNHHLAGNSLSYLCANNGNLGVGLSSPGMKLDISESNSGDGSDGIRLTCTAAVDFATTGAIIQIRQTGGTNTNTNSVVGSLLYSAKASDAQYNVASVRAVVTNDNTDGVRTGCLGALDFMTKASGSIGLATAPDVRVAQGNVGVGTATNAITARLQVKGAVGQSQNLQEWMDSSANVLASVSPAGNLSANGGANGQIFNVVSQTELVTINASASSATTFVIPQYAVILGVSVRTTVAIPTATSYTVTGTSSATAFNNDPVSTAAGSTDAGTAAGAFTNPFNQTIRITPDVTPASNTGRVRVTCHYYVVSPPTS